MTDDLKSTGWEQPRFHTSEAKPAASWYMRHRLPSEKGQAAAVGNEVRGDGANARGAKVHVSSGLKAALSGSGVAAAADGSNEDRDATARRALEKRTKKKDERRRRNQRTYASRRERKANAQGKQDQLQASLFGD